MLLMLKLLYEFIKQLFGLSNRYCDSSYESIYKKNEDLSIEKSFEVHFNLRDIFHFCDAIISGI